MSDLDGALIVIRAMMDQDRAERAEMARRRDAAARRTLVRVGRETKHVRELPRVHAHCARCGRVHRFANAGNKLIGYGCGATIRLF